MHFGSVAQEQEHSYQIKSNYFPPSKIAQFRWIVTHLRGSITRGLLSFCANYAKIIKVHSLINKLTLKEQKKTH